MSGGTLTDNGLHSKMLIYLKRTLRVGLTHIELASGNRDACVRCGPVVACRKLLIIALEFLHKMLCGCSPTETVIEVDLREERRRYDRHIAELQEQKLGRDFPFVSCHHRRTMAI